MNFLLPIIEAAAKHVGERVIGLDPMRTDFIWTKLYRDLNWIGPFGASMCAISGLDMALLDLKAKVLGVPMYQLLGGAFRTSIPLYANYWFTGGGHTADDYATQARKVKEAGFGGLKFDPFAHTNYLYGTDLNTNLALTPAMQDRAVVVTKAVREAIGPEMDMMIETHAMMNGQMAVKMAERLAPFGMTWYEEPAGPENADTLRVLFLGGRTEEAIETTRRVVRAQIFGPRGPYPDEDAIDMLCPGSLYPRVFTEGLFGIIPTGLDSFTCAPRLPDGWPMMALRDMRAFGRSWDLIVEKAGDQQKVTIESEGKTLLSGIGPAGKVHSLDFSGQPDTP